MPPTGVTAMSIDGTTVVLEWQELPNWSPPHESFAVYYKPVNTVRYQRVTVISDLLRVCGLNFFFLGKGSLMAIYMLTILTVKWILMLIMCSTASSHIFAGYNTIEELLL